MRGFYRVRQLILLCGDILSYNIGLLLALTVRTWNFPTIHQIETHVWLFAFIFFCWVIVNYINGLYDLIRCNNNYPFYRRYGETALFSLIVGVILFYLAPNSAFNPKTILFLTVLFGYGIGFMWRIFYNRYVDTSNLKTNLLLVGYSKEMEEIATYLTSTGTKNYTLAAWIDPTQEVTKEQWSTCDVRNSFSSTNELISRHNISIVVTASHLNNDPYTLKALYSLLFTNVQIVDMVSFYQTITGRIPEFCFSEGWFLENLRYKERPVYDYVRTIIDYLTGTVLFFLLAIVILPISAAIYLESKGPIFFTQKRVGRYGKVFTMYKFRSMYALSPDGSAETTGAQFATKGDVRVTRFGKFLRKTRLDELPQAINLLRRDISLIGPRPERPEIVEELTRQMPYYPLRHTIFPGLTGWAVLHQNYTDTYETSLQKLQYDLYYIKNRSPLLDLSIFLRTINLITRMMGQ